MASPHLGAQVFTVWRQRPLFRPAIPAPVGPLAKHAVCLGAVGDGVLPHEPPLFPRFAAVHDAGRSQPKAREHSAKNLTIRTHRVSDAGAHTASAL